MREAFREAYGEAYGEAFRLGLAAARPVDVPTLWPGAEDCRGGAPVSWVRMEGVGDVTARRPVRLQDLKHCIVCSRKLVWPSLYFCGPACTEAWVNRHRESAGG